MDNPTPLNQESEGALNLKKPDFTKKYANIHYLSESTSEYGTIIIREYTTIADVMRQYCRWFPKEAKLFKEAIALKNASLTRSSGMSNGGRMMSLAAIPEIIMTACKFLYGEDYWDDKKNTMDFIRANPGFMVGDHRKRRT